MHSKGEGARQADGQATSTPTTAASIRSGESDLWRCMPDVRFARVESEKPLCQSEDAHKHRADRAVERDSE